MKTVTVYEAEDRKLFRTEAACLEYEQQCKNTEDANEMLENGATLMAVLTKANQLRPLWDCELTIEDKNLLMRSTKDTRFVVPRWHSSKELRYKVSRVNNNGEVLMQGGEYGSFLRLRNFLRVVCQTDA